ALDPAPEERTRAVADRRQVDGVVGQERAPVGLARHAAFADHDVDAGELEPAVQPFGKAERSRRGYGAYGVTAVGRDARRGRAMEIGAAQFSRGGGQPVSVLDSPLIDALACGEDAAREIGDRADFEL